MPDAFISRAGMEAQQLDEKFTQTELSTLKEKLVQMQQAAKTRDDALRQLEGTMRLMQANLDSASKVLDPYPTVSEVASVLRRRQLRLGHRRGVGWL